MNASEQHAYVLIAQSWRRATPRTPWHILRVAVTYAGPMAEGLCGTETPSPHHAEVAQAGTANGGKLCQRCRREYVKGGAFIAQGPRPASISVATITETAPKPHARARAYQLRNAMLDMANRYGQSCLSEGIAVGNGRDETGGKSLKDWHRAASRQFRALQRLSAALRDLEA